MRTIWPGQEVDSSLSGPELLNAETQNWFNLLHHYESNCWGLPAPTEGRVDVFAVSYAKGSRQVLGQIPTIGRLALPEGANITAGGMSLVRIVHHVRGNTRPTAHAVRVGFDNPAQQRAYTVREARSILPVEPTEGTIVEAGLGFAFFRPGRDSFRSAAIDDSDASYRIVLSHEGEAAGVIARRVERRHGVERVAEEIRDPDPAAVVGFMQLFRETMWSTVYEPA